MNVDKTSKLISVKDFGCGGFGVKDYSPLKERNSKIKLEANWST